MDVRRLSAWDWLTGLTGLLLFLDLFLPWYGAGSSTANAWVAFSYVDLLIALAALAAIALVVVTASARAAALPHAMSSVVLWLAVAAAVFAVIRLINVPGVDTVLVGGAADITRKAGAFIGVVLAIALVFFVWRARRDRSFPGPAREHPTIEPLPPATAPVPESEREH